MKKVLFAIVLVGGLFVMSSCSKECTCTAKYNGEVLYETNITLEDGEKCSDGDTYINIAGQSLQMKCTPNLF